MLGGPSQPGPFRHQCDGAGLKDLECLPNLRCLELANSKLTDAGMEGLAGLTQLEVLGIEFTDVGDEGLEHLTCLTKLQILGLNNWRTTRAGRIKLQQSIPEAFK